LSQTKAVKLFIWLRLDGKVNRQTLLRTEMRWLLFLLCFPAFAARRSVVPGVVGEVSMQFSLRVVRGDAGWYI